MRTPVREGVNADFRLSFFRDYGRLFTEPVSGGTTTKRNPFPFLPPSHRGRGIKQLVTGHSNMRFRSKPPTLSEIVADILKTMPEADKANVVNTAEEDLVLFHNGWGQGIRNGYNLWRDTKLVKSLGVDHPDDASMVIIKAVWKALRDAG